MNWKNGLNFLVLMVLLPCLRDVLSILGLGVPLNQVFHFFSHIQKYDTRDNRKIEISTELYGSWV